MSFDKITVIAAEDGSLTASAGENFTLVENAMSVVSAPLKAFSTSDTYVSEKQAGINSLVWGVAGFIGGDALGNKRGREGKGPLYKFGRV